MGAGDYQCKTSSSSIQLDIVALARDARARDTIDSLLARRPFKKSQSEKKRMFAQSV